MIDQVLAAIARTDIFTLSTLLIALGFGSQQIFERHNQDVDEIYTTHNRDITVIHYSRLKMDYAWVCDSLEKGTAGKYLTQQKITLETDIQLAATELGIEPSTFCEISP